MVLCFFFFFRAGDGIRDGTVTGVQTCALPILAADCGPVALGVLDQLVGLRDPHRTAAALEPVVEDDAGDLAALAGAGAVAEKPAAPEAHGSLGAFRGSRHSVVGLVDRVGAA